VDSPNIATVPGFPFAAPVPTYTFPFAIIGVMNFVLPLPEKLALNN
jgi:hypothetical protein